MLFARIRRAGALASLVAAMGFVAPAGASAAVHGQPTAVTVTPEFARTVASGSVGLPKVEGVQVAQNRGQIRGERRSSQRQFRRQNTASRARVRESARRSEPRRYANRNDRRYAYRNDRRYAYRDYRRPYYRNGYRHYYGGRYYTYRDNYWYDDGGAIVAAGLIGLAAGALVGSAYDNDNVVVVDDGYGYGYSEPYSSAWYRADE